MQTVELAEYLDREFRGARQIDTLFLFQNFRDGSPFDVLHGDEEISIQFAIFVELDDTRIGLVQLLLDGGATTLRLQDQLRQRIGRFLNNF